MKAVGDVALAALYIACGHGFGLVCVPIGVFLSFSFFALAFVYGANLARRHNRPVVCLLRRALLALRIPSQLATSILEKSQTNF
jgi:hypothetical protein